MPNVANYFRKLLALLLPLLQLILAATTATTTNSNAALAVQVTISGFAISGSSGDSGGFCAFCAFCASGIASAMLLTIKCYQSQSELIGFILINRISSDKHLCPTIHYNTL